MSLAVARVCDACSSFPCRCEREPVLQVYVEPRVRIESCACGGHVVCYDPTDLNVMRAVREHNATVGHAMWRREVGR